MGRHRRTAPAPPPRDADARRGSVRRGAAPVVRTGMLGVSAAVAVGAVAMASGLLPGGNTYTTGSSGDSADRVRASDLPTPETQGAPSGTPSEHESGAPASRSSGRSKSPSATPSRTRAEDRPSAIPSQRSASPAERTSAAPTPSRTAKPSAPPKSEPAPKAPSGESAAEARVLKLVNQERAQAGCSPVRVDAELAELAGLFSTDMAERGFFDHTDPDGNSPWDRAEALGIGGLGGENIARGQQSAEAVMQIWMNSPGHRANILNCDYKTLGVGVHFGSGGPWWTQDFGF